MAKSTCVIDQVVLNKNNDKPVLVSFQQQQRLDETKGIEFQMYKEKNQKESNNKLHLVAHSTANVFTGTKEKDTETKYCVGVLDKRTGKMRVFESDLYLMKSHIEVEKEMAKENNLTESLLAKKDALTLSFGSKRKQKVIESRLKHEVVGEHLDVLMKETALSVDVDVVEPQNVENEATFVTVNWEAMSLHEVYDLDEIVTERELEFLNDAAAEFAKTDSAVIETWRSENKYQSFILNRLENFKGSPNAIELIKMLLYLQYLIQFAGLRAQELRKKDPLPVEIPYKIRQKIVDRYLTMTVGAKNAILKTVTPELKDTLIAHIIVLGLTLNNFKMDMQEVKSFKYSRERLAVLSRMIGAQLVGNRTSRLVELKLPLKKFTGFVGKKGRK